MTGRAGFHARHVHDPASRSPHAAGSDPRRDRARLFGARLPPDAARSRIFAAMVLALAAAQILLLDATMVLAYALF